MHAQQQQQPFRESMSSVGNESNLIRQKESVAEKVRDLTSYTLVLLSSVGMYVRETVG